MTILGPGQATPAPWMNVIANPTFGFQVSESGSGYTWAGNSRENQLTPWSNDPVSDPAGEAIYVRDEETGELWSPTALPIRREDIDVRRPARPGLQPIRARPRRHRRSTWSSSSPLDDPLKISRADHREPVRPRTAPVGDRLRRVGAGDVARVRAAPRIVTELDPETRAILARNPWNADFAGRVAFVDLGGRQTAWTADRTEFLGRNGGTGSARRPDPRPPAAGPPVGRASTRARALQASVELRARGADRRSWCCSAKRRARRRPRELIRRGRSADHDATLRGIAAPLGRHRSARSRSERPTARWTSCSTAGCSTRRSPAGSGRGRASTRPAAPTGSATSCRTSWRCWSSKPELAREQLLRAAARQFDEGDVQHWWHPPTGRGVRTRISDDRLWLPYVVDRYVEVTGDAAVLDEVVPFLDGPALRPGQDDAYFQPERSARDARRCSSTARAPSTGASTVGAHGLPADGVGRLERRHEPGRPRGTRRERLARAGSCTPS